MVTNAGVDCRSGHHMVCQPRKTENEKVKPAGQRAPNLTLDMNKLPPRLDRVRAAEYLWEKHGIVVSPRTLEAWPIAYRFVHRCALYEVVDLDRYAEGVIANASRRMGRAWTEELRGQPRELVA